MKCNQNFKKNFVSHCNVFHIINEILECSETKITCVFFCDFESLPDDVLVLYRTKYIAKLKYLFWLSTFHNLIFRCKKLAGDCKRYGRSDCRSLYVQCYEQKKFQQKWCSYRHKSQRTACRNRFSI